MFTLSDLRLTTLQMLTQVFMEFMNGQITEDEYDNNVTDIHHWYNDLLPYCTN